MQQFSRYKKDKIAHFHKDNGLSLLKTIREFSITYKELYKIIDNSRIFNQKIIHGVLHKKCSGCLAFKPYTEEYYYRRKGTNSLYSACKDCMKLLANTYRTVNGSKIYNKRKDYFKEYSVNNKETISIKKSIHYKKNRLTILENKRVAYAKGKAKFIKRFLFTLQR